MRLNRKPNLFLRFLYRSLIILNLFKLPITFSFTTLSEKISRFCFFSSAVKGFFLFDFLGSFVFICNFFIPVYPLSHIPYRFLNVAFFTPVNLRNCSSNNSFIWSYFMIPLRKYQLYIKFFQISSFERSLLNYLSKCTFIGAVSTGCLHEQRDVPLIWCN